MRFNKTFSSHSLYENVFNFYFNNFLIIKYEVNQKNNHGNFNFVYFVKIYNLSKINIK